jgi:hypothetical protein
VPVGSVTAVLVRPLAVHYIAVCLIMRFKGFSGSTNMTPLWIATIDVILSM